MNLVVERLNSVKQQIVSAATDAGRSADEIRLIAVSKTRPAEDIEAAFQAGQHDFGENYLQEALDKIQALSDHDDICWHFIGAIQSNKTRPIAEHFDWVHSVDREKIATRLSEQRPVDKAPLNICLQVNVSGEASKSGIAVDEVAELASRIKDLPNIRLRGLMAIPLNTDDIEQQRVYFRQMKNCLDDLNRQGYELDTLSMGMSNDMAIAIAEGATMIRIGTAIFGARAPKQATLNEN